MAESVGIIIEALHVAKAVYDQAQKVRHLKPLGRNMRERAKIIKEILENEDFSKKIEGDVELKKAVKVIIKTLKKEVQPYLSSLSEKGKVAKIKIFFQAGSYTEEYERLTGTLDGAINVLNMALGIQTTLTVEKIAEENKAIQQELEEVSLFLKNVEKEARKQGKSVSSLENYLEKLDKGIQELTLEQNKPSKESIQITREFYYQSAIANIEKGVALKGIGKDGKRSVAEINELGQGVPEGQESFIECAVANKPGGIAAVLPVENTEALEAVLGFLDKKRSGSGCQSEFFKQGKKKEDKGKEEAKETEGISCEKTEKGEFRVNIHYSKLQLTPAEAQAIQSTLKGEQGEGAYAYISSSEPDRRGNITGLLFEDKEASNNLIKVVQANIAELKQASSVQRAASPVPKH